MEIEALNGNVVIKEMLRVGEADQVNLEIGS